MNLKSKTPIAEISHLIVGLLLVPLGTRAEAIATQPPLSATTIVERGPHHRVLQSIRQDQIGGQTVFQTNIYTELATGMHYQQDGQWVESDTNIEITNGVAVARRGQHVVVFAGNANTSGAIDMLDPEGKRFKSHALAIAYRDYASDTMIVLSTIKDSIGQLSEAEPNRIVYADAFANSNNIRADLRYSFTRAGLEQDVILKAVPTPPEALGLNPATTELIVITEFVDSPVPAITSRNVVSPGETATNQVRVDQRLNFGIMQIGFGKAFDLNDGPAPTAQNVPVVKTWIESGGRRFLTEGVRFESIRPMLEALGKGKSAQLRKPSESQMAGARLKRPATNSRAGALAGLALQLPGPKQSIGKGSAIRISRSRERGGKPEAGLVLDYTILITTNNMTLQTGSTYFVSGDVGLWGLTIQHDTCVKFSTNGSTIFTASISCEKIPYHLAVFTSMDDNSVGATISGSSGSPTGYYAGIALCISGDPTDLGFLRIDYAQMAIQYQYDSTGPHSLSDSVLAHCRYGISCSPTTFYVSNCLMYEVSTNFYYAQTGICQNVTFYHSGMFNLNGTSATNSGNIQLGYCQLIAVTNLGQGFYDLGGTTVTSSDNTDFDSDGLSNLDEIYLYHTNPISADSDGDYVRDGWELAHGYDPRTPDQDADYDGDGMPNWFEAKYGLDPADPADAAADNDGDGLTNLQEYTAGTDPGVVDSDGDGVPDGWEVANGMNPLDSSDADADNDGDGLTNRDEYSYGTNPNSIDSDGDGIDDFSEIMLYGTSAIEPDSDYDGRTDAQELSDATDPLNAADVTTVALGSWNFGSDFVGDQSQQPLLATNVTRVSGWTGTAVAFDTTNAAILKYSDMEGAYYSQINFNLRNGSMRFWFQPNWSSADQGGTGPQSEGRLINVGRKTNDASYGWWAIYFNADGTQLRFGSQASGSGVTNLAAAISWTANDWHQIVLNYTETNSAVYIDGQISATGPGLTAWPNRKVRMTDGLSLGANALGQEQCRGLITALETFNYPLDPTDIANSFDSDHDGLPDVWEEYYFGNLTQTASGDFDGDGISNYSEFINRMNPATAFSPDTNNVIRLQIFTPLK